MSPNRIASLAVLAILTFALSSLQAQSSATSTAPPPAAEKTLRQLTSEQLQKIILLNQKKGLNKPVSKAITDAMGMTKGDEIILGRLYIPDTNPDKFLFFQPTGNLNGYFLGVATADGLFVFYVDKSLSLISAAQKLKGKDAVAVSVSDDHVKKNMNLAMDCWAGIADDADTPCSGEQQKKLRETER